MSTEATGDGGSDMGEPDTGGPAEQDTAAISEPAQDEESPDTAEDAGREDASGEAADSDGTASEDDEDEEDEDEELDETPQGRPARRWPRMLLAFGFVVLALAIVGGAVAIVGSVTHGFKKPVKVTYKKAAVFSLKTGDCFDPQGDQSYTRVSCDSAHVAEVFATFVLSGTKWPGTTAVASQASSGCATRLTSYLNPELAISLASTYVYPGSVAWQAGTRTVICEVRAPSGDLTGSVRGASATAG
jgi:hypothetical protein